MKILPDLWIAHPAADGCPVSFGRWFKFWLSQRLYRVATRFDCWAGRLEWNALYGPDEPYDDDDIPF